MYLKIALPVLLAGLFAAASCTQKKEDIAALNTEVPVYKVQSQPLTLGQLYVADLRAVQNVEIRSKLSGFLDGIYVDEGQKVRKGQILFRIADGELRTEVAKAQAILNTIKAEARIAELEYDRVKVLVQKNIISKTELDLSASKQKVAEAKTQEAETELLKAQQQLSYATIRAPFDGVVDRIALRKGSLLAEGTLITTVSDISTIYAYFDISENEYLAYAREMAKDTISENRVVELILSNGRKYEYKGNIQTVVGEFDENTGSISFRASFPNPGLLLKHRASGKVSLTRHMNEGMVIPQKAAFEIQDKNYVYTVDADNVVKMKTFVPSGRIYDYYIVQSGLQLGERIVYEGIQGMKEGMKVIPKPISQQNSLLLSAAIK